MSGVHLVLFFIKKISNAYLQTGNVVAVKTVKMRRENAAATKREVELSMLLRHPSIIRTLAVYAHAYVAAVMRAWNPSSALGSAGCVVKYPFWSAFVVRTMLYGYPVASWNMFVIILLRWHIVTR